MPLKMRRYLVPRSVASAVLVGVGAVWLATSSRATVLGAVAGREHANEQECDRCRRGSRARQHLALFQPVGSWRAARCEGRATRCEGRATDRDCTCRYVPADRGHRRAGAPGGSRSPLVAGDVRQACSADAWPVGRFEQGRREERNERLERADGAHGIPGRTCSWSRASGYLLPCGKTCAHQRRTRQRLCSSGPSHFASPRVSLPTCVQHYREWRLILQSPRPLVEVVRRAATALSPARS